MRRPPLLCRRHLQIPFRSNIQAGSTVYVGQTGAVPEHHLEICGCHWCPWVSSKRPFFSFPQQTSTTSTANLVGALWYTCHTTDGRINRNVGFIFWIVYGFFVSTLSTIPFLNGSNTWQHLQRRLALPIFLPQWRHAFERCFAFWPGFLGELSGTGCGASVKTN